MLSQDTTRLDIDDDTSCSGEDSSDGLNCVLTSTEDQPVTDDSNDTPLEGLRVLVLSASYLPIDIVNFERAVVLWAEGKTQTLEVYVGRFLHSPSVTLECPAVVRFFKSHQKRKQIVRFSREAVFNRDGGKCCYCSQNLEYEDATLDHVVPRTHGGTTTWTNVVISCHVCNTRKGSQSLAESGMKLRVVPYRPKTPSKSMRRSRFLWRPGMPAVWRNWLIPA